MLLFRKAPLVHYVRNQKTFSGDFAKSGIPLRFYPTPFSAPCKREIDDQNSSKAYGDSSEIVNKILEEVDKKFDHSPITIDKFNDLFKNDILDAINKSPDFIRKAINVNLNKIFFINENCVGQPCYYTNKGIRFNIWRDKNNKLGKWLTLFHEMGHRIDAIYGGISNTNTFRKALKSDFERAVKYVMINNALDRDQAYSFISDELKKNILLSSVSDIFGGLSDNKCVGNHGHFDKDYWKNTQNLTKESFANFFSAYARGNKKELRYLQQTFPTATAVFENAMRSITK